MTRIARDERGATLVLAIVFMVVLGAISAATLSLLSSSLHERVGLDVVRNRQYAADAGVEAAIADSRTYVASWAATAYAAAPLDAVQTFLASGQCGPAAPRASSLNGVPIWVRCSPAPALHSGYFQFNVIFTACTDSGCSSAPIVNAAINFDIDSTNGSVQRTYVQSWSVNT